MVVVSTPPQLECLKGQSVFDEDVPTPLVYVERRVLERNLERMAAAARESRVALRPHTKTHKLAEVARLQLDAGASGLTVAKLGEAEALAAAGVSASFMVAQPYTGSGKARRHLDLARETEVVGCVDDLELARTLGVEADAAATAIDLVLIVDTGYGRFGVPPADAPARAEALAALRGVRFRGIRSHTGHAYAARTIEARRAIAYDDARTMVETADAIRTRGLECAIVSVGSTPGTAGLASPTAWEGVSEWRPGNYVFLDRMQVSIGSGTLDDCALRVVTSVVSAPAPGRALVDAGKKTLTSTLDPFAAGYGAVLGRPDVELHALSEECGWLRYDGAPLRVGDRLTIVPNHACELTNLVDVVAYGADGTIEGTWVPVARGKVW